MTTQQNSNTIWCPMCEHWHENNTYCQRNDWYGMKSPLDNYLQDLVCFYGYRDYNELTDADKQEFAGLLIHTLRDSEEALTENNDLDSIMHFLGNALRGGDEDNKLFLYHLKKKIVKHLEPRMINLFDNVVHKFPLTRDNYLANQEMHYV